MFFRILKSSLLYSKDSKFLAFLTIFLSVSLIACMLNLTLNIGDEVAKELRSYGSNIIVLPRSQSLNIEIAGKNYSPLKNEDYLLESDLHKIKEIFWRNNITAFAPFLPVQVGSHEVLGTYFDKPANVKDESDFKSGVISLYPFWVIEGNYPQDDSLNEVLVGSKTGFKIGDIIELNDYKVKVSGIVSGSENEAHKIITSLKLAQILANKPNLFSFAKVSAMTIPEDDLSLKARRNLEGLDAVSYDKWYCSAYVSSIAYQISEDVPNASAKAILSVSETQSSITKKIQNLMGVVSILSLFISAICITSLLSSEIHKRKKEIGLLKALGANNFSIYAQFGAEIFVICLISSLCGILAGFGLSFILSYQIFGSFVKISFMVIPLGIVFGIFICILGLILPFKSLMKLMPAEVLYGRK